MPIIIIAYNYHVIIGIYNIYNYLYNSFSFQKLKGEFKIQSRNLSWFAVAKALQSKAGNDYICSRKSLIYVCKKDIKCTTMTTKWVIIDVSS